MKIPIIWPLTDFVILMRKALILVDGTNAGQTVLHVHVHLIQRRDGDAVDPRGGVRGVIPNKQRY